MRLLLLNIGFSITTHQFAYCPSHDCYISGPYKATGNQLLSSFHCFSNINSVTDVPLLLHHLMGCHYSVLSIEHLYIVIIT